MRSIRVLLATVLGVLMLGASLVGLLVAQSGGQVRSAQVGEIPIRLYATASKAPTVIIAHGFAGSTALMDPLARSLMRRGFTVVSYDTLGHGAHPEPLRMDATDRARSAPALQESLDAVLNWSVDQPEVDPQRLTLLGHSMGAGTVVEYAIADAKGAGRIQATVALSLPSAAQLPTGEAAIPRNLLLAVGALEPANFQAATLEGLQRAYPQARMGQSLGDHAQGTARSAILIPGAEHIGIVFSTATADAAATWIGASLGVPAGSGSVAPVLGWFVLALIGTGLLLIPLGRLLLGAARTTSPVIMVRGVKVLLAALAAAVLASLAARLTDPIQGLVPVAVGGYIAVWFLVAGAVGLGWWAYRWRRADPPIITLRVIGASALLAGFVTGIIAVTGRASWAPFAFVGIRPLIAILLLAAFAAYFGADALLTRGRRFSARLGVIFGSRLIAIAVILASVPLLQAPGFLILLLPLMIILLLVLGWYAAVLLGYRDGWLAAMAVQAVPLAALVATTFPLVASP